MIKHIFLIFTVSILCFSNIYSQILPAKGIVFEDTEVSIVKIEMDQDSLDELLAPGNEESYHEYPARFIFSNSYGTDTVENIGFRLRGNTSRFSAKKSFKVSFNTFFGGRKFHGIEKMNLNGEHNDPSIIRSKISFDLFNKAVVPASRSNHVELYINDEYKGLYINVEHIDEEFAESRFGNKNGNLFKCLWPATLEYISNNPNDYKFMVGDRRAYELRTNVEEDDYTDLANFIDILNNTPAGELHTELEPVFNVNSYLKYLAIEILTGHWDAYSYNKNNFYLYHNQQTDKFDFIPYDLDNTYGIDWFGEDWGNRNIYNWEHDSDPRPLTTRLLENQVYKDRFSFIMEDIMSNYFDPAIFFNTIDNIKAMITSSAENDLYRTYDYGWSIQDFHDSYTQALGAHVTYGLKPYITTRFNSANAQINVNPVSPVISQISFTHLFANRDLEIFVLAEDEDPSLDVHVFYQVNSGSTIDLTMLDNGTGNDLLAGDNVYSVFIPAPLSGPGTVDFYVSATDDDMNTSYEPLNGMYTIIIPEQSDLELYINEIMASNSNTVADEFGEYDDWLEIYNGSSESIWLGDKYLSDDHYNPSKWQMPDVEIHAGDFMLFWADNDTEQGDYHTSFKLSAAGEELGIYDSQDNYFAEIDFFVFDIQQSDVSIGRIPDGTGDIIVLPYATPGWSNTTPVDVPVISDNNLKVFPNPYNDMLNISFNEYLGKNVIIRTFDITGRQLSEQKFDHVSEHISLNSDQLQSKPGVYLLSIYTEDAFGIVQAFDTILLVKN